MDPIEHDLLYGCTAEEGRRRDARHALLVVQTMGKLWAEVHFGGRLDLVKLRQIACGEEK